MLELSEQQKQQIQKLLAQRLPSATAVAFGSRVTGWQHGNSPKPYSDLDIALWGLRLADDLALAHLRADLEESALPWRVDLTEAKDLPTALLDLIEEHGELLQGSAPARPAPA